jgi:hypothetical protein
MPIRDSGSSVVLEEEIGQEDWVPSICEDGTAAGQEAAREYTIRRQRLLSAAA